MKKIIEVSIGSINFSMEEDAYFRLKDYMERFKATITDAVEASEVMEDVEARVAEIFQKEMKYSNQVVDIAMVQSVINHLGDLGTDTNAEPKTNAKNNQHQKQGYTMGEKRLYRDSDNKMIGGVCSGLAAYFDIDPTLIRILFVIAFFVFSSGLWAYFILLIVMPKAITIPEKLAMRGYAATAENIRNFTHTRR